MRRLMLLASLTLTACWNFDADFEGRCADGGYSSGLDACGGPGDAGPLDSGTDDAGAVDAGSDGGAMDAGAMDAGAMDAGGIDAGGWGARFDLTSNCTAAGWCWQHPPQTANTFYAVWGDDTSLFVAGSGPVLRFDGAEWHATSLLPARADAGLWGPDPVVSGAAVDDAGRVWLVGEGMPLLTSSGEPFAVAIGAGLSANSEWDLVSAGRGAIWVFRDGANPRQVRVPGGAFGATPATTSFPRSAFVDDEWCLVSTSVGPSDVVYDCFDGGVVFDGLGKLDGGNESLGTVLRLGDGGVLIASGSDRWWPLGGNAPISPMNTGRIDAWSRTSFGLLACGSSGFIYELDTNQPVREPNYSGLRAAWTTPQGPFWAVGEGGAVVRVTDLANWESRPTTSFREHLRAGWVDDDVQVAVGVQQIFERTAGQWHPRPVMNQHSWLAVARRGTALYLLDWNGDAYRVGDQDDFTTFIGTLARPPENYLDHTSAIAVTPDGGVLFGSGHEIRALEGDGGLGPNTFVADAGVQVVSLTSTDLRWVAATRTAVWVSENAGGTWSRSFATSGNGQVSDVAACPDGTVAIAGSHGLLNRLELDGGTTFLVPSPILRTGIDALTFNDAWCAPDGTVWTISDRGLVHRVSPDGGVVREATGWGRRTNAAFSAPFIGGNSTSVFLFGDHAAVLARPLP